jgi:hypothetical protein
LVEDFVGRDRWMLGGHAARTDIKLFWGME